MLDEIRNRAQRVRNNPDGARLPAEDVLYLLDLVDVLAARLGLIAKNTTDPHTYKLADDALFRADRDMQPRKRDNTLPN